jgi:hypothetical protein
MPEGAVGSILALAVAFTVAVTYQPAQRLLTPVRRVTLLLLAATILSTPLLIPADARLARLVASIVAGCLAMKLVDLHLGAARGPALRAGQFAAYLGNVVHLVQRRTGFERQPSAAVNRRDYLESLLGILLAFAGLFWSARVNWAEWPFLLQHAVRAGSFFVGVHFLFRHVAAAIRLFGVYSISPERQPFLARTPAEFWRRYNRWIGQFLQENVYLPLGGRRHPVRATLLVFAVSGLLHEYLFLVATGRLHGYQMAFFLLQGIAVAMSLRIRPTGAAALAWWLGTWTFHLLTSLLFFASLHSVVKFYTTDLPTWLAAP